MTGETVECFNCGRSNPGWAQVCRSCGMPLVAATSGAVPAGPFPTDQRSLLSMAAAIGTIVLAVIVGLLFSNLNPTDPTVGMASPTPTPHASVPVVASASLPAATEVPTATPAPAPKLPGTLVFGTARDKSTCAISGKTSQFGPGTGFAHAVTLNEPFGVNSIGEEVVKVAGGKETIVQPHDTADGQNPVAPKAKVACYQVASNVVIQAWGTGSFVMRIYRGNAKIAEAPFTLTK